MTSQAASIPLAPPILAVAPPPPPTPIDLSNFISAVKYVMENEDGVNWDHDDGEFTNDPRDPGGATMWGIVLTEYQQYLGRQLTPADVAGMSRDTALAIYKAYFWNEIGGDSIMSFANATAIMDTAVNKGLGGCRVILRDALNMNFGTDIPYGSDILAAVNALPAKSFIAFFEPAVERYIAARIAKYPNMEWARNGWMNRAKRLLSLV